MWTKYQAAKRNLEHAEAVHEESKVTAKPEGIRPMHRLYFLGLFGPKVDSINFYEEQVREIGRAVEAEQQRTLKEEQLPAAFVFFNNRRAAAEAAQVLVAGVLSYLRSWCPGRRCCLPHRPSFLYVT